MSTPDRDRSVEHLLAEMRRTPGADVAAGEACLDAADLAAWAEGALPASRTTAIEAHLATCARCQGMAAAFVKSEPAPEPRSLWSRWHFVVPAVVSVAAAATFAVALWPRQTATPAPTSTVAQTETAPVSVPPALVPAPPAVSVQPQPPAQPGGAAETDAPSVARAKAPAAPGRASAAARAEGKPAAPLASAATNQTRAAPVRGDLTADQALKIPTARDPWQVVTMAPGVVLSKPNSVGTASSGQQLTVSAFGTSSNVQWNLEGGNIAETPVVAEFVSSPASAARVAGGAGRGGGSRLASGAAPAPPTAREVEDRQASPVRWRIFADGHVDRSTDNGLSWLRMSTDPAMFITAGAAPSATTCWLGGRAGLVLVTNDNEHFTRVDIPDHLDVKTVAVQADVVSVVTTTGVMYSSVDAGKTWTRRE